MSDRIRITILDLQGHLPNPLTPVLDILLDRDVRTVHDALASCRDKFSDETIVSFTDEQGEAPAPVLIARCIASTSDVWHAGLHQGTAGTPEALDCVLPQWMFTTDPKSEIEATSWRLSWRGTLVRSRVIEKLGFIDPAFETLDGAFLDLGHRWLRNGAIVRHVPELFEHRVNAPVTPPCDQLRFIRNRIGARWVPWAAFRMVMRRRWTIGNAVNGLRSVHRIKGASPPDTPYRASAHYTGSLSEHKVSVIIPTLHRYPYLLSLLDQFRAQTHPPYEIIVVDQTDHDVRRHDLESLFPDLPLRVMQLDAAGQCISRNAAIESAGGRYLLFVDDDDDIPATLIEDHLRTMLGMSADAVSGIADEAGAGPLHREFLVHRVSDVFPTNNSLLVKERLRHTGMFDLVYDRGQRADGDLGFRLYRSGAMMLLDPDISVFHHHAPAGGLRVHGARATTRAGSRRRFLQWNLLSVSDFHLLLKHCGEDRMREAHWINLLSIFFVQGGPAFHAVKGMITLLMLPFLHVRLRRNARAARALLQNPPGIPAYPHAVEGATG